MVLELMVACGKGYQDPFALREAQKINFAVVLVLDTHQSLNWRMPGSYVD